MKRNVELFLYEGYVIKAATKPSIPKNNLGYGNVEVLDRNNSRGERLQAFTMYNHSFVKPKEQPNPEAKVYFFLIPMEYIVDDDQVPVPGAMLAVNVSEALPFMKFKGDANRHPCTTVLTISPDKL